MTHLSNAREFDINVFGATSFVGKLTAQYLVDTHPELAIAVAGRNESKLQELAHTSGIKLPILVADASRIDELRELTRSEEHTSELQSRGHLVCRLLLEKKKK